jgi:chromosome segregation protein
MGQARGDLQSHLREVQARAQKLKAIDEELKSWTARNLAASRQKGELATRLKAAQAEHQKLVEAPDVFVMNEKKLASELGAREEKLAEASKARAKAEAELAAADAHARQALAALGAAREAKAASEARVQSLTRSKLSSNAARMISSQSPKCLRRLRCLRQTRSKRSSKV